MMPEKEMTCYAYDVLSSTNAKAKELQELQEATELPFLVRAARQTEGRGQGKHKWFSPIGNIYMSLVLPADFIPVQEQFILSKAVSVGLRRFFIRYISSERVKIKPPNDLYVEEKKIAGILIENKIYGSLYLQAIVGIGINTIQTEFPADLPNPTSLILEKKSNVSLPSVDELTKEVAFFVCQAFDQIKNDFITLEQEYDAYLLKRP